METTSPVRGEAGLAQETQNWFPVLGTAPHLRRPLCAFKLNDMWADEVEPETPYFIQLMEHAWFHVLSNRRAYGMVVTLVLAIAFAALVCGVVEGVLGLQPMFWH